MCNEREKEKVNRKRKKEAKHDNKSRDQKKKIIIKSIMEKLIKYTMFYEMIHSLSK